MAHQKHSKLAAPGFGQFGRREWALLGAPCGTIQQLAQALSKRLSHIGRIGYVDADHKNGDDADSGTPGFALRYTDKIGYQQFERFDRQNAWEQRAWFNDADLVLVNGNHFPAARQIVLLDRRKMDSLQRKTERLTQVDLFITCAGDEHFIQASDLPGSVKEQLPGWSSVPVLDLNDLDGIARFLENRLAAPPLQALILSGGKSTRMGQDKAALDYHGIPQWQYLHNLLRVVGINDIFISCRAEQAGDFPSQPIVADTFLGLGPMGAILSAFQHSPQAAWLVLACDLPLLDADTIRYLIAQRLPSALATAFRQTPPPSTWPSASAPKESGFPEPLVTIWEPKSYLHLLQFMAQGVSCPRKVLINSRTHLLEPPNPEVLLNANTPEERVLVLEKLKALAGAGLHTGR